MNMFKVGAFAIITNENNEFLLGHRCDYDLWNLIGGLVEKGETPWEAVVREVKEEVGLDVKVERLWGVYSKPDSNGLVFNFKCKIIGGKITETDEADKIKYFKIDEIPKNTSPNQVARIKDYIDNPEGVVFKKQIGKSSIQLIKEGKL